jgi:hypothetical protein
MPRGGKRNGAGRPAGSRNKKSAALRHALQSGFDPIDFLCDLAQDESQDVRLRLEAVKTLLPYVKPRLNAMTVSTFEYNGDPASIPTSYLEEFIRGGMDLDAAEERKRSTVIEMAL